MRTVCYLLAILSGIPVYAVAEESCAKLLGEIGKHMTAASRVVLSRDGGALGIVRDSSLTIFSVGSEIKPAFRLLPPQDMGFSRIDDFRADCDGTSVMACLKGAKVIDPKTANPFGVSEIHRYRLIPEDDTTTLPRSTLSLHPPIMLRTELNLPANHQDRRLFEFGFPIQSRPGVFSYPWASSPNDTAALNAARVPTTTSRDGRYTYRLSSLNRDSATIEILDASFKVLKTLSLKEFKVDDPEPRDLRRRPNRIEASPDRIEVSDDGSRLFVHLNNQSVVYRVDGVSLSFESFGGLGGGNILDLASDFSHAVVHDAVTNSVQVRDLKSGKVVKDLKMVGFAPGGATLDRSSSQLLLVGYDQMDRTHKVIMYPLSAQGSVRAGTIPIEVGHKILQLEFRPDEQSALLVAGHSENVPVFEIDLKSLNPVKGLSMADYTPRRLLLNGPPKNQQEFEDLVKDTREYKPVIERRLVDLAQLWNSLNHQNLPDAKAIREAIQVDLDASSDRDTAWGLASAGLGDAPNSLYLNRTREMNRSDEAIRMSSNLLSYFNVTRLGLSDLIMDPYASPSVRISIARALARLGRIDDALVIARFQLERVPDSEISRLRASILEDSRIPIDDRERMRGQIDAELKKRSIPIADSRFDILQQSLQGDESAQRKLFVIISDLAKRASVPTAFTPGSGRDAISAEYELNNLGRDLSTLFKSWVANSQTRGDGSQNGLSTARFWGRVSMTYFGAELDLGTIGRSVLGVSATEVLKKYNDAVRSDRQVPKDQDVLAKARVTERMAFISSQTAVFLDPYNPQNLSTMHKSLQSIAREVFGDPLTLMDELRIGEEQADKIVSAAVFFRLRSILTGDAKMATVSEEMMTELRRRIRHSMMDPNMGEDYLRIVDEMDTYFAIMAGEITEAGDLISDEAVLAAAEKIAPKPNYGVKYVERVKALLEKIRSSARPGDRTRKQLMDDLRVLVALHQIAPPPGRPL